MSSGNTYVLCRYIAGRGREVGEVCSIVNKGNRKTESRAAMLIGRQEGREQQDKAGKGDEGGELQRYWR